MSTAQARHEHDHEKSTRARARARRAPTHQHSSTNTRALEHEHDTSTTRARAREEHSSTRVRARGGQAISASYQSELSSAERHSSDHVGLYAHDRFCMAAARRCQVVLSRNVSIWVLAKVRRFKDPEHAPRTSAEARTCAVVYTRVPCVPRG